MVAWCSRCTQWISVTWSNVQVEPRRVARRRVVLGRMSLGRFTVAATLAAAAGFAPCDAVASERIPDTPRTADSSVRVHVREGAAIRALDGRLVVEAADGGLLVELADTGYVVAQPGTVVSCESLPAPVTRLEPPELGRRLLAELPAGFNVHLTQHYVVCHDTSRDYARWAASLFERLHDTFGNYWTRAGLELGGNDQPLAVLIFADRRDYEAYAARDLGAAAQRVVGYYNLLSNRVATYDLTGSDALPRRSGGSGPAIREILAQPEAAGLVSTLVHEATHQLAFNHGLHQRLAPVPVWVSEGIATVFETPDVRSSAGWRGIGLVNRPRLERFRRTFQPGDVERLVTDDNWFRDPQTALDAYAGAWALTWFLMETRRPQFVAYQRILSAKRPLEADTPRQRGADFAAAFGMPAADLEPLLLRHVSRLELRRP